MDRDLLAALPVLAGASPDALTELAAAAEVVDLAQSAVLVEQGAIAEHVHLVLEGRLAVEHVDVAGTSRTIAELGAGEVVGEIAAMTAAPRNATVRATTPCRVARVPDTAFRDLLDREPEIGQRLARDGHRRLRETQLVDHLTATFPGMTAEVLTELRAAIAWVELPAGEALFGEGDDADAAYLLVSGRLRAERQEHDVRIRIGEVSPGQLVGEQALIEGGTRSATIRAIRDAELGRVDPAVWTSLLSRYPQAMLEVARVALVRAREPVVRTTAVESTVALVAADDTVDVSAFAQWLTEAMSGLVCADLVSRERIDAALGVVGLADADEGTPQAERLGRWLSELEDHTHVLVLETDREPTNWTRRAIRMAEHVVVVADATTDPQPRGVEAWLDEPGVVPDRPRRSLVLLQPPGTQLPSGTGRWLAVRSVDRHHHVRPDVATDIGRLARHLAGRAVGVALSGGGARGFGHIGAVRALHEHGFVLDVVAGSSMGAAVGALVAMDHPTHEELLAAVADGFRKPIDYTLPMAGLARGRRIAEAVDRQLGDRGVEDLPIPLLAITTDLTNSRTSVQRRGDARRAVRASVAIPGVLPPVVIDDALHVDGGVLDNLPITILRDEVRSGTVIAIDVAPPTGPSPRGDFGTSVSGWRQMGARLLPGKQPQPVPALSTTAMRSLLAGATRTRDQALTAGHADLYLQLGRLPCGLLEFERREQVIEAGYAAASEPVAAFARERTATGPLPSSD